MNPQLCEMKWQTVHFIIIPEAIRLHKPQSQRKLCSSCQTGIQRGAFIKEHIYTHTLFFFSFNGEEWHRALTCKVNTLFLKKTPRANSVYVFTSQKNKMIGMKLLPCGNRIQSPQGLNTLYLWEASSPWTTQFYFAKRYLEKLYFILMMNFRIALFAVPWFSVSSEGHYPSKWLFTSEQEQGTEVSLSSTGKTCHLIPVRSIISFETSQDALVQSPLSTAVFWRSGMRALVRQLLSFSGKY